VLVGVLDSKHLHLVFVGNVHLSLQLLDLSVVDVVEQRHRVIAMTRRKSLQHHAH